MKNIKKAFLVAFGFILFLIFCQVGFATPLKSEASGFNADESGRGSNKAVTVNILSSSSTDEIARQKALEGKVYIILNTTWENIHPKQKVEKSKLEGKTDRSMGVGGLRGGGTAKKEEYVDMDVAYLIKSIYDHAYLLADGLAYPLHQATEELSGGIKIFEPFALQKLGDKKDVSLLYSVPETAKNLAFQFFDYKYGHILLPIKGDTEKARGTGSPSGKVLGEAKSDLVEMYAQGLDFQQSYAGKTAPQGWHYAVVKLSGKSLSGKNVRDIVQLKLDENFWVNTDGGYLYYGSAGSTTKEGFIRFTPEVYMLQEVAFLVPEKAESIRLGLRAKNEVFHIDLKGKPQNLPAAKVKHTDGDIMEVMLLGTRRENGNMILDLGIRSLNDRSGLEIQTRNQFILLVGNKQVYFDQTATNALAHKPPKKFVVPPGETVRFELAFVTEKNPTQLYFRGYRSQAKLDLTQ
jgi:hypothetical protein